MKDKRKLKCTSTFVITEREQIPKRLSYSFFPLQQTSNTDNGYSIYKTKCCIYYIFDALDFKLIISHTKVCVLLLDKFYYLTKRRNFMAILRKVSSSILNQRLNQQT